MRVSVGFGWFKECRGFRLKCPVGFCKASALVVEGLGL